MATANHKAQLTDVRNLHWVFKVADRTATAKFYQEQLGMTVLRHEEFDEACAAACNGPYDGRWSKTMIGYGSEDDQFVLELTYNYGVKHYDLGNDYRHIVIRSKKAYASVAGHSGATPCAAPGSTAAAVTVQAPGGYTFIVVNEDVPAGTTVMTEISLNVSDLSKSLAFWSQFLGFSVVRHQPGEVVLSCSAAAQPAAQQQQSSSDAAPPPQAVLRLAELTQGQALNRGSAFGRIAFSTPGHLLKQLEQDVLAAGWTVHTPYVSLDTPGKATVQVVILQDPDGHEICFVGDEGFRDLSQVDPGAPRLLAEAVAADKSEEWMQKRARQEAEMAAKGV